MKRSIVLFFLILVFTGRLYSQSNPVEEWFMFEDEQTGFIGYKDIHGNIEIEPKFNIASALVFKNIIPVTGDTNDKETGKSKYKGYYLMKDGKQVGIDSLYATRDTDFDCESEGKIRFRDYKTDKVGFFDKEGKVVIPAVYDDAQPFYNNLALAIKDAKKVCWEGVEYDKENPCEHWNWIGNTVLINSANEIVLDSLDLIETSYLDMYSLKINQVGLDSTYVNFKAKNGDVYSFVDANKQFERWFFKSFVSKNKTGHLDNLLFKTITLKKESVSKSGKGNGYPESDEVLWIQEPKEEFLLKRKKAIYKILDKINNKSFETIISNDSSPMMFSYKEHPEYFTDCGEYNTHKYPYFTVNITEHKTGKVINYLGFIRTTEGKYRLVEVD